ncbi:MAG: MOSC domain-containing protein [Candidatus Zixiibacteriota bacterium]
MSTNGRLHKISISEQKGEKKGNIDVATLTHDYGIVGDAHAGSARQVSLLPFESFAKTRNDVIDIKPGDFAENFTTTGIDLSKAEIGQRLRIGQTISLEITQIGKECHHGCYIREVVGDCIMPREGLFARVVNGGQCKAGDSIWWDKKEE